jgi:hypothetical protein
MWEKKELCPEQAPFLGTLFWFSGLDAARCLPLGFDLALPLVGAQG